ncbi:MAG: VCBS repeat-containing protein [Bacteroidota bacterium]|nr:VCBS repeat-containing protein [Bacteroidota bacterium]
MISSTKYVSLFFVFVLLSCKMKKKDTLFELQENTGINFVNEVNDDRKENSFLFRNFYNGGGVAIGDINNDGLPDVFLTANMGNNKLYLNKGHMKFEDISKSAGIIEDDKWNTGVVFADINGDGWLDIYVCSSGHMPTGNRKNKLYINNHNLTFTESAAQYGLDVSAYTTQVSFFDYDMDGDLDCFMINNSPIPVNQLEFDNKRDLLESKWPVGNFLKGGGDHLFRNDNGKFVEVTQSAGIHGTLISFGMGVSVGDINGDGYPDVYVANDSYERDYLYINQKNGTFKDMLEDKMQHTSFSSMGADIADINNDGYPDLFSTDMLPLSDYRIKTTGAFDDIDMFNRKIRAGFYYHYVKNCLQLNSKSGNFTDIGNYAGVSATDWSWGALMFDMDNDGWNDIYVCNGVNHDVTDLDFMNFFANDVIQKMVLTGKKEEVYKVLKEIPKNALKNKVYRNNHDLHFTDIGDDWGFTQPTFSNGAAYGDLDGDGDLDLIINNENQPAFVYKNNAREINKNNYVGIVLKGKGQNPFAVGSKIMLYANHEILTRELIPSRGFQSSVDYKQIIGLGKMQSIDSLQIMWPNRTVKTIQHPAINQVLTIQQDDEQQLYKEKETTCTQTLFTTVSGPFEKHVEDDVVDFYLERNIPRLLSREGPKAAIGDLNGDGLQDVFIGGTPHHPGQVYIQNANGSFTKKEEKAFQQFLSFEDVAVTLFDCDHDGDLDLLIGPGGNNNDINTRELQLRLFKNDGKGNFSIDANAFPNVSMNVAVAAVNDFNGDGFPDVFIGARSYPREYGYDPTSFLFVNDGKGHFTDIAATKNPDIAKIGMVTNAVWADVTGDAAKELIIAGEWMAPRIFSFHKDHFEEVKTNLSGLYGWWQTVNVADLNGDGKPDLVLGNIGENFYLHPDENNPVKLWLNDFDQNGITDKIMTYTVDGKDKPVVLKHDLEEQLPSIKKNNLKHAEYASKSIQELFSSELISKSKVKQFTYCSSIVAINKGNGQFDIGKLPPLSQMSCINAISFMDVNGDGHPDIVSGGNQFGFLPQFERLDGSLGDVLLNDGKGHFKWVDACETGLLLKGEVRDIQQIDIRKEKALLILQNNTYPVLVKLNQQAKK